MMAMVKTVITVTMTTDGAMTVILVSIRNITTIIASDIVITILTLTINITVRMLYTPVGSTSVLYAP